MSLHHPCQSEAHVVPASVGHMLPNGSLSSVTVTDRALSHACLQPQEHPEKLIPELCIGEALTHHGRDSPNTGWVVKGAER